MTNANKEAFPHKISVYEQKVGRGSKLPLGKKAFDNGKYRAKIFGSAWSWVKKMNRLSRVVPQTIPRSFTVSLVFLGSC
jgi:hypothetical protein